MPDIPTFWTGGEIESDGGTGFKSECSPSIMSSCNAKCNKGYGGGGEYICQYNDHGKDICELINTKITDTGDKQNKCNTYPACKYDSNTNTCSHDDTKPVDGHLEWIGSPCYKLDNTAFSHGIAELPELDEAYPPVVRIIVIMVITIPICFYLFKFFSKYLMKTVGRIIDYSMNITLRITNKIIDYNTVDNKLVDLIFDKGLTPAEKLVLFGSIIGMFIGFNYLFFHFKDQIKDRSMYVVDHLSEVEESIKKLTNKIKINFKTSVGTQIADNVQNVTDDLKAQISDLHRCYI